MQLCFGIIEMRKEIRQKQRDFLHSLSAPLLFFACTTRTDRRRRDSINNTVDTANTDWTLYASWAASPSQPSMFLLSSTFCLFKSILRDPS